MTHIIDPMILGLYENHDGMGGYIERYHENIESRIMSIVGAMKEDNEEAVGTQFGELCMFMFQLGRKYEIEG